ncbi:hypothetical protein SHIRM173S_06700 [Streptomyces hirsutus]
MRQGEAPDTFAASTNSRSASDSTELAHQRWARPIQPRNHITRVIATARR